MPPAPKDPVIRQRTNRKSEQGQLSTPVNPVIPELPNPDGREFHHLTLDWWRDVWSSPMATRYLKTDLHGLAVAALLLDQIYKGTAYGKTEAIFFSEFRQQTARFGLSNWDRNRMNWTITDIAERKPAPQSQPLPTGTDPRKILKFDK